MRRGLVIGAGGALGYAWSVGALRRFETQTGWDPRAAEIIVGTSAGSVIGALLASGVRVADLPRTAPPDRILPPLVRGRPHSLRLLAGRQPPLVRLCGLLPAGRSEPLLLSRMVPPGGWPAHGRLRVMAMDADSGERVAFGAPGAPAAPLADAVAASCAIPGWVAPVAIGGRRYLDGGAVSPTSLDLAAGPARRIHGPTEYGPSPEVDAGGGASSRRSEEGASSLAVTDERRTDAPQIGGQTTEAHELSGLEEVLVVSPMTSARFAFPGSLAQAAERLLRAAMSRVLNREVAQLEAAGTRVIRLEPTAHDLRLMGANFMDGRRSAQVAATWDA